METNKIKCFTCDKEFSFGHNRYNGKTIPTYGITVCDSCYQSNYDGWAPQYEEKIIKHMENENFPIPKRNDKGLLPRS